MSSSLLLSPIYRSSGGVLLFPSPKNQYLLIGVASNGALSKNGVDAIGVRKMVKRITRTKQLGIHHTGLWFTYLFG